jgi:hypothetical protein
MSSSLSGVVLDYENTAERKDILIAPIPDAENAIIPVPVSFEAHGG